MFNPTRSPNRPRSSQWQLGFFIALAFVVIGFMVFARFHIVLTPRMLIQQITETSDESVLLKVEHTDTSAPDGFINAWRQDRETCKQWINMQRMSGSYLDAYIIGSQKGATSELTKRLFNLGARRPDMKKEWHYFNKITENGTAQNGITSHRPLRLANMKTLRFNHYKSGFPEDEKSDINNYPLVDDSPIEKRTLAYDGTVNHFHTDKAAFLAHALTPHAKIVATIRDPIERAISQFNMVVRTYNMALARKGEPTRRATSDWFHTVVKQEIEKLKRCGYNPAMATLDRPTSKMLRCMFGDEKVGFDNLLYVTRGLYHLHISTWRNYFPDHRILILSFHDIAAGKRKAHEDLTKFLCIRPFNDDWLKSFEEFGSVLSYGQQVAQGMENRGVDHYDTKNDSYMPDIKKKTRKLLNDFYRPGNQKLEAFLGRKMYDYE